MARLSMLPNELIHDICCHIRDGDGQVDSERDWAFEKTSLASFCRTSKDFDKIVRPCLYNRIQISFKPATLVVLIRTLARRSDLSLSVQHLKIKSNDVRLGAYTLEDTNIAHFTEAFRRWWPEGYNKMALHHALCRQKKLADLLYVLVPNVETIHVCLAKSNRRLKDEAGPSEILLAASQLHFIPLLDRLRSLHVGDDDKLYYGRDIETIDYLLLERVTSLCFRRCSQFERISPGHVNIRDLSLYKSILRGTEMEKLMKSCRGLRKFAYTTEFPTGITPKECITALMRHSSTLVELYLLVRGGLGALAGASDTEVYDSFDSFTSLKKLSIHPLDFMLSWWGHEQTDSVSIIRTLPKSLKVLRVIEWSPAVAPGLFWLGNRATRGELPHLELLEVQCHSDNIDHADPAYIAKIKQELRPFENPIATLPLQITLYDGDGRDPLVQSALSVLHV